MLEVKPIQISSNQIASCKDVVWVNCLFESFKHLNARVADAFRHELFTKFANSMVMRDRPTVLHDLFTRGVLDLRVDTNWVSKAVVYEPKVDVYYSTSVIDLCHSERDEGFLLYSMSFAVICDLLADCVAHLRHIFPRQ